AVVVARHAAAGAGQPGHRRHRLLDVHALFRAHPPAGHAPAAGADRHRRVVGLRVRSGFRPLRTPGHPGTAPGRCTGRARARQPRRGSHPALTMDTGEGEMGFEQLIRKVEQAENAIEANERAAGADLRQLKASWKDLWTPGRIVLGGLGAGLLVGLADANRMASTGTGALRLMSMVASLSGLVAGTSAQSAAEEAG